LSINHRPVIRRLPIATSTQPHRGSNSCTSLALVLFMAAVANLEKIPGAEELRRVSLQQLRVYCNDVSIDSASFLTRDDFVAALMPFVADAGAVLPATFQENLHRAVAAGPLKIIFLDVDGVLNTSPRGTHSRAGVAATLDGACVQRLAAFLREAPGVHIVISSSWRSSVELKLQLFKSLCAAGMPETCFVGQTPHISFRDRATEIVDWLSQLPDGVLSQWAVVDDMDLSSAEELQGHFLWVDDEFGLVDKDIVDLRALLGVSDPHDLGTAA